MSVWSISVSSPQHQAMNLTGAQKLVTEMNVFSISWCLFKAKHRSVRKLSGVMETFYILIWGMLPLPVCTCNHPSGFTLEEWKGSSVSSLLFLAPHPICSSHCQWKRSNQGARMRLDLPRNKNIDTLLVLVSSETLFQKTAGTGHIMHVPHKESKASVPISPCLLTALLGMQETDI